MKMRASEWEIIITDAYLVPGCLNLSCGTCNELCFDDVVNDVAAAAVVVVVVVAGVVKGDAAAD